MVTGRFCNRCDNIHYHDVNKYKANVVHYCCNNCGKKTKTKANGRLTA